MNLPFSVYPSGWIDKRLSSSLCTLEHMKCQLSRLLSMMYGPFWRSSVHLVLDLDERRRREYFLGITSFTSHFCDLAIS